MNFVKIVLPKDARVLLLEDSAMRIAWFEKRIANLSVVSTVADFKDFFREGTTADFIFLDHDLGTEENGADAAKHLNEAFGSGGRYTVIHSWNARGAQRMRASLPEAVVLPFGQFELEVEQ